MDLCKQSVRAIAQRTRWNSSLSKREGNWTPFLKRRRKVFYVCIQDSSFNNSDNDTMKLSVNEAKLTGLWPRNCATITKVLILNLPSSRKVSGLFEKQVPGAELTFAKTSGTVTGDRERVGQWLTSSSPVTLPETISRRISAPVPFCSRRTAFFWALPK